MKQLIFMKTNTFFMNIYDVHINICIFFSFILSSTPFKWQKCPFHCSWKCWKCQDVSSIGQEALWNRGHHRSLCASVIIVDIVINAVISPQAKALLFLIEKPDFQTGMKLSSQVVILRNMEEDWKLFFSVSQLFTFFSYQCWAK